MAIVISKNDARGKDIARLSLMIALLMTAFIVTSLLFGSGPLIRWMGAEPLGAMIWLLPLALLCVAIQDIANYWALRLQAFRLIGVVATTQAFLGNSVRILGGLTWPSPALLVLSTTVMPLIQAAMIKAGLKRPLLGPPITRLRAQNLAYSHRDFFFYRAPNDLLNSASQSLPTIMLAALFSPIAAGLYTLSRNVLNLPISLIGNAIGDVLYPRYAAMAQKGHPVLPLLLHTTAALFAISPVFAIFSWLSPSAFSLIFGDEWLEAGYYARWMSLWIAFAIANVPAIRLAPVIRAQGLLLIVNVLTIIIRFAILFYVYYAGKSALAAVAAFSISSAGLNAGIILAMMWAAKRHDDALRASYSEGD